MQLYGSNLNLLLEMFTVPNVPPVPPAHVQAAVPNPKFANYYHQDTPVAAVDTSFLKRAAAELRQHENCVRYLYKDTKGHWTIGIGHLVTPEEMPKFKNRSLSPEEINEIFQQDIQKKLDLITSVFGSVFNTYSDNLKIAILDGFFRGDLSGSPKAIKLLKQKQFKEAAKEYLNNNEYRQSKAANSTSKGVYKRMLHNATVMAAEITGHQ
jgi:GH24 family phage-related lysozyme (muramidase)